MEKSSNISGIIVVNKPAGLTSRDVVNRVSRLLSTKKVGHTGTLDPMATGVLVLVVGTCTKLVDYLTCKDKEYVAKMVLGYETDTLDVNGEIVLTSELEVSKEKIEKAILSFIGTYDQEVPAYSAVKIDGKKLYEYARLGMKVELPKRKVNIISIDQIEIQGENVEFRTSVSKGTYIRSLIRDIGKELGTYATMSSLKRTKQGKFSIEDAFTLEDIERNSYKILSPEEVLSDIKRVTLDEEMYKKVVNGVKIALNYEDEFITFFYEEKLIALYKKDENFYRMYIKFA